MKNRNTKITSAIIIACFSCSHSSKEVTVDSNRSNVDFKISVMAPSVNHKISTKQTLNTEFRLHSINADLGREAFLIIARVEKGRSIYDEKEAAYVGTNSNGIIFKCPFGPFKEPGKYKIAIRAILKRGKKVDSDPIEFVVEK